MESAEPTAQPEVLVDVDTDAPQPAVKRLYFYSTWVHVGPGAASCEAIDEKAGTNSCSDPLHFHAWLRLPNQFQREEIRTKGLAASARRTRTLHDPDSDSAVILEADLDQLARAGDMGKAAIIDDLLNQDFFREYVAATKDVIEGLEDAPDDEERPYEHIADDQERYGELEKLTVDERGEEFDSLKAHIAAYSEAVNARHGERMNALRAPLEEKDLNTLIDLLREERIGRESNAAFTDAYQRWSIVWCALTRPHGEQIWKDAPQLISASPEAVEALIEAVVDLERFQREARAAGNS